MKLPFLEGMPTLKCRITEGMKRKEPTSFINDSRFYSDYKKYVAETMKNGYAEKISEAGKEGYTWYVPHHGVCHPEKLGKIYIVFDCTAKHKGIALNDLLLQGPDIQTS